MKIVPIIPAYNPDEKLLRTVDELIAKDFQEIIIVNDGSHSDEIFKQLANYRECIILNHEVNKGKCCDLKTAFTYYKEHLMSKYKGVVTLDADGQHDTNDVLNLAQILTDNDIFILGSRLFDAKETPTRNKFGNRLTSKVFKKLYGVYLKDTQTGLRAIPNRLINLHLKTEGDRFEYELNALIDLVKQQETILQINIKTVYLKNSNKKSHFKVFNDSYKLYKILFKRRKEKV